MLFHQELRELAAMKSELQPEIDELAAEIKRLQAIKRDRENQIAAIEEPLREKFREAYVQETRTDTWQPHPLVSVYRKYHADYTDDELGLWLLENDMAELLDIKVRRSDFQEWFRDDDGYVAIDITEEAPVRDGWITVVRIDKLEAALHMSEEA